MSDLPLVSRPALAGKAPLDTAGIRLRALPEGHVIHVLARPGADPSAALAKLASGSTVRPVAPGQWFIVGDALLTQEETGTLLAKLGPDAVGVDQSHGRVRILISGRMVERVLAKGIAADLALAAFPVGHATTALVEHIAAHVTRVGEQEFELMVLRGFAESLWDGLVRMSAGT